MKYITYFFIFIFCMSYVSATYYNSDTAYCEQVITTSNDYLTVCPPDYRNESDWFKVIHYTVEYSMAKCVDGKVVYEYCPYEILEWTHPKVSGSPSWQQPSPGMQYYPENEVPEFTIIGAIIALTGASIVALRKRR